MYKKIPLKLLILCMIFAVLLISSGVVVYYRGQAIKCNKFGGVGMNDKNVTTNSDYEELVADLNNKYFLKTCDIFDAAKNELLSRLDLLLGEEYKSLNNEIKALKEELNECRRKFDEEKESKDLKESLAEAKEKLTEADSEDQRAAAKEKINVILTQITKRNLANFSALSAIKKQIDEKSLLAMNIVNSKEKEFKEAETEIIGIAKGKSLELAVSYRGEVEALSRIFDMPDEDRGLPFLSAFDPNMRLIDFDKEQFIAKREQSLSGCGDGCEGNCSGCAFKPFEDNENKNYFKSEADKKFKD